MKRIIFISLLAALNINTATADKPKLQAGGICFRMDDNHNAKTWGDIAKVFNKHNQKFGASLNLRIMANDNKAMLKKMQEQGHEIMDHTPLHDITRFRFAPGKNLKDYQDRPGVDHINGNTVYLSYVMPTTKDCTLGCKVRLDENKLTLTPTPGKDILKKIRRASVVFIPSEKKVYKLNRTRNQNEYMLRSVWGEKNVKEPPHEAQAFFIRNRSFSMTPEGLELLGRNSLDLFAALGAKRPYTWIQPGGGVSVISAQQAASVFGKRLGYKSAATYINKSKKVYNEYDPDGCCAFGMMWGDFDEEKHDLEWNKTKIANLVALHHVAISHSHMHPKDGWIGYMDRLDKLLAWCKEKNIPIRTQSEWAEIMYAPNRKDQSVDHDVFPSLLTDRDENGKPDGYKLKRAYWDPKRKMIVSRKSGELFSVDELAGLYKGKNRLSFGVESGSSCQIKVSIKFPGTKHQTRAKTFSIDSGKKIYFWDFTIPEDVSVANFSWRLLTQDKCGIFKISLQKK